MVASAPNRKNQVTFITFLLLLGALAVVLFRMFGPYFLALFMGAILALMFRPLFRRLRSRGMGARPSSALLTLLLTLVLIGPVASFSVIAVNQSIDFAKTLSGYQGLNLSSLEGYLFRFQSIRDLAGSRENLTLKLQDEIQGFGRTASSWLVVQLSTLPDLAVQLTLVLLTFYFFLIDGPRLLVWMRDKVPLDADVREILYRSFKDTAISSIWATVLAAAVQAVILFIGFLVLGVPGAFFGACVTFFFAWIPVVGSAPVWIGAAIYLFAHHAPASAAAMIGFGILTSVADHMVKPWMLRGRSHLHPLFALVGIFGGIHMFGLLGVFFGPILTASFVSLLEIWPEVRKRFFAGRLTPMEAA